MKKFLSLVLALIMTMSLVTISAGATEYRDLTDKDEIQYEEAVAVLNRIGVITGYEDGSFRPETELTRGAAAKIIVSLLIGPEAAANLPNATAPYPDVPASHTFAGVISYCKTAGIISGYGDGTFKPANSLTGFAFAKMLLGALGYKSEIEGFVDTGWTMNVARIGNVTGLFDRLDFDGSAAVNRETACQLALNTLKATMVTYGGTTLVTGAQALAVQGTQAMYVTSNNREINANINRRVISAANNEMTLEFGEEHFKDLRLEHDKYDPAYDEYGHPSNEWSWKKVTIGTFKLPADFTYTKQMSHLEDTDATKEKALGLRNYDTWSIDHRAAVGNWSSPSSVAGLNGAGAWVSPFDDATQITINGWNARVNDKDLGRLVSYDASSFNNQPKKPSGVPTIAEIADLTDNGVTVEVYVCPVDADFITNVVVTRTQLMKVKRIGSDFVTLEDIEPDSRGPRDDSDLKKITGYNAFAIDVTEKYDLHNSSLADVKDSNYDAYNALKDMKVGDYVAVVPYTTDEGKTWEVGEAYAPETVSGAFTKVDTYANVNKPKGSAVAITVGGTSYPINEWNKDMLNVTGNEIKATKKDVTLYLAKDGTVLWADEIGNSDAWMIVGDYYQATGSNGKVGWYVHGWTIKGTEVDLDLGTIRGDAEKYAPGELVHYDIARAGNGEYALEKPNYSGTNHYKNGNADTSDTKKSTGEGIYEVSQYTIDAEKDGYAKKYQINKRNGALALENYKTDNDNPPTIWKTYTETAGTKTSLPTEDLNLVPKKVVNKSSDTVGVTYQPGLQEYYFDYSNLLYDGVKFIFVNFDSANGEVETIDFKDGVQNVDYTDLIRYNTKWKNIGTNDGQKFVLSAAEAYVDKKGVVKAVVVKADSSEADLSKIAVITDTPGDRNNKTGAEGDRTNGLSYAKEYVTGPNFNLSEAKTGYFDKDYPIGTILVISEKENIIVGKYFHSTYYNNGNPDAVYVEGITPLLRTDGKYSEAGFLIGQENGFVVKTLDEAKELKEDMKALDPKDEIVTDGSHTVQILTNKFVSGFDTVVTGNDKEGQNLKGLIRVDGSTKFVDLRPVNTDTIDELGDLLEFDPTTVKARILVDGSVSTDLFRHAYAVIVERADGKKDSVAKPDVTIAATGTTKVTDVKGKATVGDQVVLTAKVSNALTKSGTTTYQWYKVINDVELPITGATEPMYVVSPVVLGEITYKVVVTNTDNSKKDDKVATGKASYTIVGEPAGAVDTARTGKFGIILNKAGDDFVAEVNWKLLSASASASYIDMWVENWPDFLPAKATITGKASADIGSVVIGAIADNAGNALVLKKGEHVTAKLSAEFTSAMTISTGTAATDGTGANIFTADYVNYKFVGTDEASNAIAKLLSITYNTPASEFGIAVSGGTTFTNTLDTAKDAKVVFNGSDQSDDNIWVEGVKGGTPATVTTFGKANAPIRKSGTIQTTDADGMKITADGNDFVTITIGTDLTSTKELLSVKNSGTIFDLADTNADGSLKVNASAAKKVTLSVSKDSGIEEGGAINLIAAVVDGSVAGYDVTVKTADGTTLVSGLYVAAGASNTRQITVNENIDLADAVVTVTKHEIIKITKVTVSDDYKTMVVTLNVDVDVAATVTGATSGTAAKTIVSDTNAATKAERIAEKQVQITWGTAPVHTATKTVAIQTQCFSEVNCASNTNPVLTITFVATPDPTDPTQVKA